MTFKIRNTRFNNNSNHKEYDIFDILPTVEEDCYNIDDDFIKINKLPVYDKSDRVLIIDGDIFLYKIASVSEYRYLFKHKITNEEIKVESISKFDDILFDLGHTKDEYNRFDIQEAKPISHAISNLKHSLNLLLENLQCNKVEFYIGGSGNFRLDLPLPVQYKSGRKDVVRPLLLKQLRAYVLNYKKAYLIKNIEVDDVTQMRSRQLSLQDIYCVVYSNDKDLLQNIDYVLHNYNPDKSSLITYNGGLGELWEKNGVVKGCGLKWLLTQTLLTGDTIDCYSPKKFFNKRYGAKSIMKEECLYNTEESFVKWIVDKFRSLVGEEITYIDWQGFTHTVSWLELGDMYFQCAYMKLSPTDNTTFKSFIKKYGYEVSTIVDLL